MNVENKNITLYLLLGFNLYDKNTKERKVLFQGSYILAEKIQNSK